MTNKTKTSLSILGVLTIVMVGAILLDAVEFKVVAFVAGLLLALAVAIAAGRWIYGQLSNVDATQRKDFPMTSSDRQIYLLARIDRKLTAIDIIAKIWLTLFIMSIICSILGIGFTAFGVRRITEYFEELRRGWWILP